MLLVSSEGLLKLDSGSFSGPSFKFASDPYRIIMELRDSTVHRYNWTGEFASKVHTEYVLHGNVHAGIPL